MGGAISATVATNCHFSLHEGSLKKEEIVEFLSALKTHRKTPLLVIWDSRKAHRSRLVRDCRDSLIRHIHAAFLPPCAQNRNPVECLWAWLKRHAPPNYCPNDLSELHLNCLQATQKCAKAPFDRRCMLYAGCAIETT